MNGFKYPFSSVIGNFSILFDNNISLAWSKVVPTGAVIRLSFVIISPTSCPISLWYFISLFVTIPISFPSPSITGSPEILYLLIKSSACPTVQSAVRVTGFLIIPLSILFTLSTSAA